jgi:hypothetical protein
MAEGMLDFRHQGRADAANGKNAELRLWINFSDRSLWRR